MSIGRVLTTLNRALADAATTPADAATVDLARRYARALDNDGDLTKLGPLLLSTLAQLGMTPKSRAAVVTGGAGDGDQPNPLDELRARRAARQHDAAAVD